MKSSAKSNQYLALCIEQAALSPLRFRHGCVVVKGGKVIGRGHNSYAAVHGSTRARDDAPLSLHAEMMAVDSALGATGLSSIKRAADLPAETKSKRRRRADAVQSYVERVCRAAALGQGVQQEEEEEQPQQQCGGGQRGQQRRGSAGLAQKQNGNEKKRKQNLKKSKGAQQHATGQNSTPGSPLAAEAAATCRRSSRSATEGTSRSSSMSRGKCQAKARDTSVPRIDYKLVPTAAQRSSYGVRDRMKHPRLVGADLYVLRLGRTTTCCSTASSASTTATAPPDDKLPPPVAPPSPTLSSVSSVSTKSLHDELVTKESRLETAAADVGSLSDEGTTAPYPVAESRPCYRCLSYMHAAGVKRVFWTNSRAEWEGAKVRDLIDSLEGCGSTAPAGGAEAVEGGGGGVAHHGRVFVTKHEVLRLVRLDSS